MYHEKSVLLSLLRKLFFIQYDSRMIIPTEIGMTYSEWTEVGRWSEMNEDQLKRDGVEVRAWKCENESEIIRNEPNI